MIPLNITNEELDNLSENDSTLGDNPSKTYRFDFDTGEIHAEFIDNLDAIKQAVIKAVKTVRDKYIIYSTDYGCEVQYLMGRAYSLEYLQIEIPRLIQEAMIPDDRVEECSNFIVTKEGDKVYVTFDVITSVEATIQVEVEI
jgi:Protein of unknown function (DUF2634)